MVTTMADDDIADTEAQREAGLRQQTPALVLLQDLSPVWPPGEPFVATEELIKLLVAHNPDYWGAGINLGGIPASSSTPPGSGGWSSRPPTPRPADRAVAAHHGATSASSSSGPGEPCGSRRVACR